ncbi:MAG: polymer-forming cytoskeletal protein [Alicyclobacillus sp.]|nr:polymer-forming cytoskeletal protein [Alicyclobacillus sp.]
MTLSRDSGPASPSSIGDIRIIGNGCAAGGHYRRVHVVGDAVFDGPVVCEDLHVTGNVRAYGAFQCRRLHLKGELRVDGDVHADEVHILGMIIVRGNLEGERVNLRGGAQVDGLFSADDLSVRAYGPVRVGEMGGGRIDIRSRGWFAQVTDVDASVIEGDEVRLRNIRTSLVRGRTVVVGPRCEVQRIEYSARADISPRARVGEVVPQ